VLDQGDLQRALGLRPTARETPRVSIAIQKSFVIFVHRHNLLLPGVAVTRAPGFLLCCSVASAPVLI
jgi:hypothetical protein